MKRDPVLVLCLAVMALPVGVFAQTGQGPAPASSSARTGQGAVTPPSSAQTAPVAAQPATDPEARKAAAAVVMTLSRVCLPLIHGGKLKGIATGAGFRDEHGQWMYPIDDHQRIELAPPDVANPHLCTATITHEIGAQSAIVQALDNWARTNKPPLQPVKTKVEAPGPVYLRTTSTWDGSGPRGVIGVVFATEKTLKGQPVAGDQDQSELLASFTPAAPASANPS